MIRAWAALIGLLLGAAFLRSADAAVEPTPVVDCETRSQTIGPVPPAARNDIVAGPLILRDAKARGTEPQDDYESGPQGWTRVKVPMILPADSSATIALTRGGSAHAAIMVGRDQPPSVRASRVELRACPADAQLGGRRVGPRTGFAAGFRLDGPRCLRLSVRPDGRDEPIRTRIAFGRGTCSDR